MTEGVSVNLKTDQYKLSNLKTEKKQLLKKLTEDNNSTTGTLQQKCGGNFS